MAFKKRTYLRRRKRRGTARALGQKNFAARVKRVMLKQCETKVAGETEENIRLFHNGTNYKSGFLSTSQGTGDNQGFIVANRVRVGDEIIARGLKFKFWVSNKADRPNVMYHIWIFQYNALESPTNSMFWCGTDGQGGTMNRMLDHPNPERIKVLKKLVINSKDQYYQPAPDGKEHSQMKECRIPMKNRKITYRADNGTVPRGRDIGFAVATYDAYGTLVTDIIATYAYSCSFYFKDP